MVKISLAIATYNEEENISRCLDSVKELVSEIVAVDGTSTDRTVDILRKYNSRIKITSNPLNFHINKNKAIDLCRGDWILQLDADEVVTPELKKEILQAVNLKSKNQSTVNGYWIPRKNKFLGRFLSKGGQYPDYTLRFYRRGKGSLPAKSIHEQARVVGKTAYLKNPLLHFPYPNFSHYLKHFSLYTDFFAEELKRDKTKLDPVSFVNYLCVKPIFWFISTYFRHKGFYDGVQGLIFSFFSSLRFPVAFIKYFRKKFNETG